MTLGGVDEDRIKGAEPQTQQNYSKSGLSRRVECWSTNSEDISLMHTSTTFNEGSRLKGPMGNPESLPPLSLEPQSIQAIATVEELDTSKGNIFSYEPNTPGGTNGESEPDTPMSDIRDNQET